MDDNFTTGPQDNDDGLTRVKAAMDAVAAQVLSLRKSCDESLRMMQLDMREMSLTLAAMNRTLQRRTPDPLAPDQQALLNLRRDQADMYATYALVQQRIDRLNARVDAIEKQLEPPLPPFPEFKS
jgi:hypothetical protein